MQISFKGVGRLDQPVSFTYDKDGSNVTLVGTLRRQDTHNIHLKSEIKGSVLLTCDMCADTYTEEYETDFDCIISDRPYIHEAHEIPELDVLECEQGQINIDEIVESEIASHQSDYHKCKNCIEKEKES